MTEPSTISGEFHAVERSPRTERFTRRPTYEFHLDAFGAAVRRGEPTLTPPADSANMHVLDAMCVAAGMRPRGTSNAHGDLPLQLPSVDPMAGRLALEVLGHPVERVPPAHELRTRVASLAPSPLERDLPIGGHALEEAEVVLRRAFDDEHVASVWVWDIRQLCARSLAGTSRRPGRSSEWVSRWRVYPPDDCRRAPRRAFRRVGACCGGDVTAHSTFEGLTIPSAGTFGWFYGTDRWPDGEFFRYQITDLTLVR
jgi:hypothetical protein